MEKEIKLTALDFQEAARYLGYGTHEIDGQTLQLMEQCQEELFLETRPKAIYQIFDIRQEEKQVAVLGTNLVLTGNSIVSHLKGCEKVALMAVTLSDGADRLIRRTQVTDMAKAVIMDSMASVAVEQVCDTTEENIKKEVPEFYQTFRFGLGYGDLPIELQADFIKVLHGDKRIGLHVSNASMLVPTKSVTAVIGLSTEPIRGQARGCQTCNMRQRCKFRETGGHCNG